MHDAMSAYRSLRSRVKLEERRLRNSGLDPSTQLIFMHTLDDEADAPPTGPLWELDGLLECWIGRIQDSAERTSRGPGLHWSRSRLPKPLELAMYARLQDKHRIIGVTELRMVYRRLIAETQPLPTIAEIAEHLSLPLIYATH